MRDLANSNPHLTLSQIGVQFNLTSESVRQILRKFGIKRSGRSDGNERREYSDARVEDCHTDFTDYEHADDSDTDCLYHQHLGCISHLRAIAFFARLATQWLTFEDVPRITIVRQ